MNFLDQHTFTRGDYSITYPFVIESFADLQKHVDYVMAQPGGIRGAILKKDVMDAVRLDRKLNDNLYVQDFEAQFQKLGYPLVFSEIKNYHWYQDAYHITHYLIAMYLYGYTFEDVYRLGYLSRSSSSLIKIFTRLVSMESVYKKIPMLWDKYHDFGGMRNPGIDEHSLAIQIYDYQPHPVTDYFHAGFLEGITQILSGKLETDVEVTKSIYRDDGCSEFVVTW